jgi:hypothetical protein
LKFYVISKKNLIELTVAHHEPGNVNGQSAELNWLFNPTIKFWKSIVKFPPVLLLICGLKPRVSVKDISFKVSKYYCISYSKT